MKASLRPWVLLAGVVSLASSGCGDACAEAINLCEDCENEPEQCAAQFEDASQEHCEEAVSVYEASCSE